MYTTKNREIMPRYLTLEKHLSTFEVGLNFKNSKKSQTQLTVRCSDNTCVVIFHN